MTNKHGAIAIISPEFKPHTNWGGIATFNEELSLLLADMGKDVHVFTYNPNGEKTIVKKKNVTLHLIDLKTNIKQLNFIYYKALRPFLSLLLHNFPDLLFFIEWNFCVWRYFTEINKNEKFVAIHSPSYFSPSLLIKLLNRKIKLILHIQGPQADINLYSPNNVDKKIKAQIENWFIANLADAIVSCNQSFAKKIVRTVQNKPFVTHIPNFISGKRVKPAQTKINLNNLVFWGRIEHRKGIEPLIRAFLILKNDNPSLKFWMIGDVTNDIKIGTKFGNLSQFISSLHIPSGYRKSIIHVPRIDSPEYLRKLVSKLAGICVFPSLYEPFGFVYLEAMKMGMVTLGSSCGEGKNIIQHFTNGFICDPTPKQLANTIKFIQELPKQTLTKISKNAQQHVDKHYSRSSFIGRYQNLYQKLGIQ